MTETSELGPLMNFGDKRAHHSKIRKPFFSPIIQNSLSPFMDYATFKNNTNRPHFSQNQQRYDPLICFRLGNLAGKKIIPASLQIIVTSERQGAHFHTFP